MDGKVIVVTGALGALGRGVFEEALARGARIASVDHAPTQVPATADLLELGGVDLTDAAQAKKAIDVAASRFGKLDALINIAGGFAFEMVADGDPKTWQRMYALNVTTVLNASRAAIPHFSASTAGRIVNVGASGGSASCFIDWGADGNSRGVGLVAGGRGHGSLCGVESRRASPHRGAGGR